MPYLIDGYNLLFSLGLASKRSEPKAFELARGRLLDWLHAAHGADVSNVTIVFDGLHAPAGLQPVWNVRGLRVRFAVGMLADDLIEQLVQRAAEPKKLTVISSDHRVQMAAKRRGCAVWDIGEYVDWVFERGHAPPKPPPTPAKPAAESAEDAEHWQQEFGGIDADPDVKKFNRLYQDFDDSDQKMT
ncbi:MAG: NYN domain-containing protein [Gemmataceae bacterium]